MSCGMKLETLPPTINHKKNNIFIFILQFVFSTELTCKIIFHISGIPKDVFSSARGICALSQKFHHIFDIWWSSFLAVYGIPCYEASVPF